MTEPMSERYRERWERWWVKHLRAIGRLRSSRTSTGSGSPPGAQEPFKRVTWEGRPALHMRWIIDRMAHEEGKGRARWCNLCAELTDHGPVPGRSESSAVRADGTPTPSEGHQATPVMGYSKSPSSGTKTSCCSPRRDGVLQPDCCWSPK